MSRFVLAGALIATLLLAPTAVAAQTAQGCQGGEAPHFTFGFADMKAQLGDAMGEPLTCEFPDPNGTGDVHQRTSKGLAFWRKSTNTPTFTNGSEHWAFTPSGLVTWTGTSVDPPTAQANAYPAAVVQSFNDGCQRENPGDAQLQAACSCAIERIQATIPLADFLTIAIGLQQGGGLGPDLTRIVVQCVVDVLAQ